MKKQLLCLLMGAILLLTPLTVRAEEVVLSGTLTHEHIGTAGTSTANGCYTKASTNRVYHCSASPSVLTCAAWWDSVNNRCNRCHSTSQSTTHTDYYGQCGATCSSDGHYITSTVYNLNCSLTTCDYAVTKEELAEGLLYQMSLSDATFSDNCLWEYYESGKSEPTIKQTTFSCLVNEEYDSGELYVTLTDAKGKAYILETITISKMKLVIIRDGVTHEIKKLFFDGQEIKHINFNGQKLF